MSEPAAPARRRINRTTVVVSVLGALIVAGLFVFMFQNMSQGASALSAVKDGTRAGLERETSRATEAGGSLEVSWSTTPMPGGDSDMVEARVTAEPSGASQAARFMVTGDRVTPMDPFAERLLSDAGAAPAP